MDNSRQGVAIVTLNKGSQGGFTLIELIAVIVILGILASIALPKFISIKTEAQSAAMQGVAGSVSSAFALNYAAYLANPTKGVAVTGAVLAVSAVVGSVMNGGALPSNYAITPIAQLVACGTAGATQQISISNSIFTSPNSSATATLICTG